MFVMSQRRKLLISKYLKFAFTYYLLFLFNIVILESFCIPALKETTVILGYGSGSRYSNSDTIFIRVTDKKNINDSLVKYLKNASTSVTSILIAQPSYIIDSIDFGMFPRLKELTLSGNDNDVLENRKYNFMEIKSLKRINVYAVYVEYPDKNAESSDDYTHQFKKKFRKFIHHYRPDIKVYWPNKFNDRILWTE